MDRDPGPVDTVGASGPVPALTTPDVSAVKDQPARSGRSSGRRRRGGQFGAPDPSLIRRHLRRRGVAPTTSTGWS